VPDTTDSADPGAESGPSVAAVPVATAAPVHERRHTRLQSGISRPKEFTDGTIRYDRIRFGNFCSTGEPTSSSEAFSDSRWKAAMDEEYLALMKNKTWHLVHSARGQNIIDCKWVFKIKKAS
jgi:histone deacetylase 1/2